MSKFYKANNSKNIYQSFVVLSDAASEPVLAELKANTTDAAQEKHVPVVSVDGNHVHVAVGSVAHPMAEEHYITAIYIETKLGGQVRRLQPGEAPEADFLLPEGDTFVAAYEYCNLHGLWKAEA